ncbi:THO2 plays a role in transcriptional elongation [Savitreella phatthalungensis]
MTDDSSVQRLDRCVYGLLLGTIDPETARQEIATIAGHVGIPQTTFNFAGCLLVRLEGVSENTPVLNDTISTRLAQLTRLFLDTHKSPPSLDFTILDELLDGSTLQAIGRLNSASAFAKRTIRVRTATLYKQQKYNLLREETEGFGKLVLLISGFLSEHRNLQDRELGTLLINRIDAVMGIFDLDPTRVLDLLFVICTYFVETKWLLVLSVLSQGSWFSGGSKSCASRAAANIISSRLRMEIEAGSCSKQAMTLLAFLLRDNLLDMQHVWPHLEPSEACRRRETDGHTDALRASINDAKGVNALTMAAPLPDDDEVTEGAKLSQDCSHNPTEPVDDGKAVGRTQNAADAYADLLSALLAIRALTDARFVLAEFPVLPASRPSVARAIARLIDEAVEALLTCSHAGLANDGILNRRSQPTDIKYRDSDLSEILPPASMPTTDAGDEGLTQEVHYSFFLGKCGLERRIDDTELFAWLHVAGVQLYHRPEVIVKLCRYAKQVIANAPDRSIALAAWSSVIRGNILPALSLIDPNPSLVTDIFALLREYDQECRFSFYGEWQSQTYKSVPELRAQLVRSEKEAKGLLRRISSSNAKDFGRLLAKATHSNPCVVLTIALNQIESYDNLVEVVIEASRYFTMLSFDVLTFVMLSLLSSNGKARLKSDGTSVAHWLQSISDFVSKMYRRYSHMDPGPICLFAAKRLHLNSALEIIVIQDLLREMGGIGVANDLSDEQLAGCTGGPLLRARSLKLINTSEQSQKTGSRLMAALERTRLTVPLLCLIAKQASEAPFLIGDADAHLKLLGNLTDQCQATFSQYLDFLAIFRQAAGSESALDLLRSLRTRIALPWSTTFAIVRPMLRDSVHTQWAADNTEMLDSVLAFVADTDPHLHAASFSSFWSLSLYELSPPIRRYATELAVCGSDKLAIESERDVQTDTSARAIEFLHNQALAWFREIPVSWVPTTVRDCILPRAFVSPNDAIYASRFLQVIHEAAPDAMPLFDITELLLGPRLSQSIFTSTEREAQNFGRFLAHWVTYLRHVIDQGTAIARPTVNGAASEKAATLEPNEIEDVWLAWHKSIWQAVKLCLNSGEYMHIRNSLVLLERLPDVFPSYRWIGRNLMNAIDDVVRDDTREDIKIRAQGYKAVLKKREHSWIVVADLTRNDGTTIEIGKAAEGAADVAADDLAEEASISRAGSATGDDLHRETSSQQKSNTPISTPPRGLPTAPAADQSRSSRHEPAAEGSQSRRQLRTSTAVSSVTPTRNLPRSLAKEAKGSHRDRGAPRDQRQSDAHRSQRPTSPKGSRSQPVNQPQELTHDEEQRRSHRGPPELKSVPRGSTRSERNANHQYGRPAGQRAVDGARPGPSRADYTRERHSAAADRGPSRPIARDLHNNHRDSRLEGRRAEDNMSRRSDNRPESSNETTGRRRDVAGTRAPDDARLARNEQARREADRGQDDRAMKRIRR